MTDQWTPRDDLGLACDLTLIQIHRLIEACEEAERRGIEPTPEIVATMDQLFATLDRFKAEVQALRDDDEPI